MNKNLLKKIIFRSLGAVLAAIIALIAFLPLQRAQEKNTNWMKALNDATPLNQLTIPGTHDSGALYSFGDVFGKCQTLNVGEQLRIGVRFFDIRLQLVNDELNVVHAFVDQKTTFLQILNEMVEFLQNNPEEFLLVSFKEDADAQGSTVDFCKTLEEMLLNNQSVVSGSRTLPETVGEARGKIHVIARYKNATLGLPCSSGWVDDDSFTLSNMYVQDNYNVSGTAEKIEDIFNTFAVANSREHDLVLNYTSCYNSPSFPPVYAGIPAREINGWLMDTLTKTNGPLGTIVCDFITYDLAKIIIERNFI
ncbi:MAG: phosphatidylinositol-specific phospholipase C [Clostridia bacterium]|nr:phosphatidylinositol-specific phospholipase C [Clostridia bacterium]